ncbi:MAG: ATP-binding protein [Phycisphaerales bacterium]
MSHDNTNDPNQNPTPERKIVTPPMRSRHLPPADPSSGPAGADQLTTLAHDLSNLIDGSMRYLGLAALTINTDQPDSARAQLLQTELPDSEDQLDAARDQINTVQATLHRMSTMVNAAMRSHSVTINSPMLGVSTATTTAMAIDHAVDVVRPLAAQAGVRIQVNIEPNAGTLPVGPLYTVVLNALFNAVQSIQRATTTDALDPGGHIDIAATIDHAHDELVIEITDDGVGLSPGTNPETLFTTGGLGLPIARQIIEQLEGIISLNNRSNQHSTHRPGATLTARVPIPDTGNDPNDQTIG